MGWSRRPQDAHKNRNGRVLVVAGSRTMPGAAAMAVEAAYRTGCGYVLAACPGAAVPALVQAAPNAVLRPMGDAQQSEFQAEDLAALTAAAAEADAVLLGPGWGSGVGANWLPALLEQLQRSQPELGLVIDADALNALAVADALEVCGARCELTPHPGEAARLLGDIGASAVQQDRAAAHSALLARTEAVVILKGHGSLVGRRGGELVKDATGGAELASAGTGDVLSGMVAALLARGIAPLSAACAAVQMHARAGAAAAAQLGSESVTAPDLLPLIGAELDAMLARHEAQEGAGR